MASLNELEDKVNEIFCIKQLNEHIEQHGIVRLGELAIKLLEDLERLRKNSKEVVLCKRIVEFLVALIQSCLTTGSIEHHPPHHPHHSPSSFLHKASNSSNGQTMESCGQDVNVDMQDNAVDDKNSPSKKKRPPTPPKKPKIGRTFHSFQYVPNSKENLTDLGASNSSLATTCSNQSTKSPSQPGSITATRTSSTFGGNKTGIASSSSVGNKTTSNTAKYTETCLDREIGTEDNAFEVKDVTQMSTFGAGRSAALNSSFSGRKYASVNRTRPSVATAAASPTIPGSVGAASTPQQHNSYPRHLHSAHQIRGQLSNLGASPSFGQSSLKSPGSLSRHFNYGSNDALNRKFNKMKANSLESDTGDKAPPVGLEDSCNGGRSIAPILPITSVGSRLARCRSQDSGPSAYEDTESSSRFNNAAVLTARDSSERLEASDEEQLTSRRKQSVDGVDDEEVVDDDDDDDDEAIYDTVAPDELTNYRQSKHINTTNNGSESTATTRPLFIKQNSLVKSLKNTFENRILAQSMENLDLHSSTDPNALSSTDGQYANYVNIDYFLRSKNDSDECETQMSQSLSSDHDIDESLSNKLNNTCSSSNLLGGGGANTSSLISTSNDSILSDPSSSSAMAPVTNESTSNSTTAAYDEVFDLKQQKSSECVGLLHHRNALMTSSSMVDSPMFKCSVESTDDELGDDIVRSEAELLNLYKCIVQNIIESETVYVDCLNTLIQYKKALKSSTESTQPLLRAEQLECIFFQIPQLYQIHCEFLAGVQRLSQSSGDNSIIKIRTNTPTLGDLFKALASRLDVYSAYLKNYANALQTLHKCCAQSTQFSDIAKSIKLKSMKGQSTSLEDLLHKPVARVQKNALVLHDLLKYTGQHSEEYKSLQTALQMTQCFLNELNIAATENMFPVQDKTQRRLVKESFIIESCDSKRKLRHLILFNDIIVCAKYRPSTRQKFTFDVKWYALLSDVTVNEDSNNANAAKESGSEIMSLKSRVSSLRDEIYKAEGKHRSNDKLKKKQADFEGQLVLLLPQLQFNLVHKNGKCYSFYLSSEFEKTQWIEAIRILQQSVNQSVDHISVNFNELQAWIDTCRKTLNPNVGSFLLRSFKDEELLYGDLYLHMLQLSNFTRTGDFYIAIETDTYGHFFHKTSTRAFSTSFTSSNDDNHLRMGKGNNSACNTLNSNCSTISSSTSFGESVGGELFSNFDAVDVPIDQDFVLDLDGTQNLRFLLFELIRQEDGEEEAGGGRGSAAADDGGGGGVGCPESVLRPIFRGKATLEFSRNWLKDKTIRKEIGLLNSQLSFTIRYVSSEASTIRVPAGKVYGAFGVSIQQVVKKEKSNIPYLIVGCVREVERRGMKEVGIYRVSSSSSDIQRLKKAFETNPYEAEHLLKEIDIHAVTGILKMYLRDLPESLFTNVLYKKFVDAFSICHQEEKVSKLIELFLQLPSVNQSTINFLIEHLTNVNSYESYNKMSLHNLATVFGPTMIRPPGSSTLNSSSSGSSGGGGGSSGSGGGSGGNSSGSTVNSDQFTAGAIDAMAQAGILLIFLKRKSEKISLENA